MSPFQLQKMRADGVPIVMIGTLLRMNALQVLTRNPEIKTFADLKGHSFAGPGRFCGVQLFANLRPDPGLRFVEGRADHRREFRAVASATGRQPGRRDHGVGPTATEILKKISDVRTILKGDEAWKQVTGDPGWELDLVMRTDFLQANRRADVDPWDVP